MKTILALAAILAFASLSTNAQAATPSTQHMSKRAQKAYVSKIAKNLRRQLWQSGYDDVESSFEFADKKFIDNYVSWEQEFEEELTRGEISTLYKCHFLSTCEPYFVRTSSNYYGGHGVEGHLILLYTKTKKHYKISHMIYAE